MQMADEFFLEQDVKEAVEDAQRAEARFLLAEKMFTEAQDKYRAAKRRCARLKKRLDEAIEWQEKVKKLSEAARE